VPSVRLHLHLINNKLHNMFNIFYQPKLVYINDYVTDYYIKKVQSIEEEEGQNLTRAYYKAIRYQR
jgi:hypothetical protein